MLTVLIIILLVLLLTGGYGFSRRSRLAPSAPFTAVRRASVDLIGARATGTTQRSRAGNISRGRQIPPTGTHLARPLGGTRDKTSTPNEGHPHG